MEVPAYGPCLVLQGKQTDCVAAIGSCGVQGGSFQPADAVHPEAGDGLRPVARLVRNSDDVGSPIAG